MVFQDNFNGSELDRNEWATRLVYNNETLDHLNDEAQVYRDNGNNVLKDGILAITARKTDSGRYESGMIRSLRTFYYGYFETRVYLPKGNGIWPAFWLNPDYDASGSLHWPPEIDVFEYVVNGKNDRENMFHSAASISPPGARSDFTYVDTQYDVKNREYSGAEPLNAGWHVFGLVWAPSSITIFLDGKRLYTRSFSWTTKSGTLAGPASILLNFAVGGSWAGRYGVDSANFPQSFKVDYVHVCQIARNSEGERKCGDSPFTPDPAKFGYKTAIDDLAKPIIMGAKIRQTSGGIQVGVPLSLPASFAGGANMRIRFRTGGASVWTDSYIFDASLPVGSASTSKLETRFSVPITAALKRGIYTVSAEIHPAGQINGRTVPLTCQGPKPRPKALSCEIGGIEIH